MALPVFSLCADSKRSLHPLSFLKKNHNSSTMFDKGVSVNPSNSGCSAGIENHKELKLHPYFHSGSKLFKSFDSVVVGGFLGSKSQVRSANNSQCVWDFICNELAPTILCAATECIMPMPSRKQYDFNSVTSPPKKKLAKEDSLSTLKVVEKIKFPSVIELDSSEGNTVEVPKQSYAEVAKAAGCKSGSLDKFPSASFVSEKLSKRDSSNCRRSLLAHPKGNKRKSNRRDRRENLSQRTLDSASSLTSSNSQLDTLKDLRLSQQEKHFSPLKIADSSKHFKKADRRHKLLTNLSRRGQTEQSQQRVDKFKRISNYQSHCDSRHCNRARRVNCDIDMINWRTGEPIRSKMGSQQGFDECVEDFPADQTLSESFSSEQNVDENTVEQKKIEAFSSEAALWPELQNSSPRCRRRSLSSECSVDSDDSFIVFQSGAPSDSLSELGSDWSDCDSDDSYESDSDSMEEGDECDGLTASSQRLKEVNDRWQKECAIEKAFEASNGMQNIICNDEARKVQFDTAKPVIHRMLTWDFAYRASRVGPWEVLARDRARFKTRIQQFEGIISPVLTTEHRNKILKQLNSIQL